MNSDKREDYYVGLDMGTGSLGGAVTDTQYHLLKVKGKDFLFSLLLITHFVFFL